MAKPDRVVLPVLQKPTKVAFTPGERAAFYGPHADSDARLFGAARELLDACESALHSMNALVGDGPVEHPAITKLKAAIAKAGGRHE